LRDREREREEKERGGGVAEREEKEEDDGGGRRSGVFERTGSLTQEAGSTDGEKVTPGSEGTHNVEVSRNMSKNVPKV
jgi:hypothetical protein